MSIGEIFNQISISLKNLCTTLANSQTLLKESDDAYSTRFKGIQVFLVTINQMNSKFTQLNTNLSRIASTILEKRYSYNSKKNALDMCENNEKIYQAKLKDLKNKKKSYTDAVNKAVELFLTAKLNNKLKSKASDLKNKKETIIKKKIEYKKQIDEVEKCRVDYMEIQGNIFASEEELERECTNEFKKYLKEFISICKNFFKDFEITKENKEIKEIKEDNENKENKENLENKENNESKENQKKNNQYQFRIRRINLPTNINLSSIHYNNKILQNIINKKAKKNRGDDDLMVEKKNKGDNIGANEVYLANKKNFINKKEDTGNYFKKNNSASKKK